MNAPDSVWQIIGLTNSAATGSDGPRIVLACLNHHRLTSFQPPAALTFISAGHLLTCWEGKVLSYEELEMFFSKAHFSTVKEFQEMDHWPQGRWFKRSLWWWLQVSWWLESWCVDIRHYYSTVMLQRKRLVWGIFSSLTFYPCWNKSKYLMFFVFRGDTGTSMTVSCCQLTGFGSNVTVL